MLVFLFRTPIWRQEISGNIWTLHWLSTEDTGNMHWTNNLPNSITYQTAKNHEMNTYQFSSNAIVALSRTTITLKFKMRWKVNCSIFSNISSGTAWLLQGMKRSGRARRNIGKYTIVNHNRTVSFSKFSFLKLSHLLIRSYQVAVLLICSLALSHFAKAGKLQTDINLVPPLGSRIPNH